MTDTDEKTLEKILINCAVQGKVKEQIQHDIVKLEHTVFGNGKEGLTIVVDRIDNRLDNVEREIGALSETLGSVHEGVQSLQKNTIDSKTVRAITQEEIRKYNKEVLDAPGTWGEFRKSFMFPVILMVLSSFVTAALTYWAMTKIP